MQDTVSVPSLLSPRRQAVFPPRRVSFAWQIRNSLLERAWFFNQNWSARWRSRVLEYETLGVPDGLIMLGTCLLISCDDWGRREAGVRH